MADKSHSSEITARFDSKMYNWRRINPDEKSTIIFFFFLNKMFEFNMSIVFVLMESIKCFKC